ncbi:glycosyltransferase family 2 protein [Oceanobacillus bengalensis]|uniref:Glycosyltransferase family 2 protein n=1 Tax=Oceanobacillus bengalensis TaxID=1435466 RepID=A0A494Z4Z8_9BACI|nr:glycosyltransferase family A protein [Oceanobacillus bengalensis]RKQ17545.1 glycosyltransferase family 2 protein [Oceanobacillus bengalensis]
MGDITVILINNSNEAGLHKVFSSLKKISSRLHSIIVIHHQKMSFNWKSDHGWISHIQFVQSEDFGNSLNETIDKLNSTYVLFLNEQSYLSPTLTNETLHLSQSRHLLITSYPINNIVIEHPLFARTTLVKKTPFISMKHLPFKEALFPSWLSMIPHSFVSYKNGLLKQTRKSNSANMKEKQKLIHKYQLDKLETGYPSLSVLISNYNMEKYIDIAIVSCLLQNETPNQILIIDDGSTDGSDERIKKWNDEKRVNVFHKKNEGKARALNYLLPHVTSNFVLELDADDWLDPDAITTIKKYLVELSDNISLLYGNLRKWKQITNGIMFKGVATGKSIHAKADLLHYHFPLGPRIYRTSSLRKVGGFPVIEYENGRLYEDVSMLNRLINSSQFCYQDFTVYNVREHQESITKNNLAKWQQFKKNL